MPYLVDGHPVPQERIRQEFMRIGRDARWQQITDQVERSRQMYAAAEHCAIDVILIEKAALSDPRPVDDAAYKEVRNPLFHGYQLKPRAPEIHLLQLSEYASCQEEWRNIAVALHPKVRQKEIPLSKRAANHHTPKYLENSW